MKRVTFLFVLALVAGCKSSPDLTGDTTVPDDRLYGLTEKSDAQLVVAVESVSEQGCAIHLLVDGKPTADVFPAELAHFGLTRGAHTLSASSFGGCSEQWEHETKISVKGGDALIMRINASGWSPVAL